MTAVKICGLREIRDIDAVNEACPDYAGMILSPGFRRTISAPQAARLKQHLRPDIRMCGVFVNAEISEIAAFCREGIIDAVQLHGSEDDDFIARLRKAVGDIYIIRAFRITSPDDIRSSELSLADMVLLDSGAGSGKTFEWSLIRALSRPYILAGGLHAQNVGKAVEMLRPWGVDTSSGVETDGKKDRDKILRFVQEARKV